MKTILISSLLLVACSSTPPKLIETAEVPDYSFPVPIEKLKSLSIQHAESKFQADLKQRRLDTDEISLRDFAFKFKGKTRPPLASSMTGAGFPEMIRKEFGKEELEKSVDGPVDIVEDNAQKFILIYRNTAYLGERLSEKDSRLTVLTTQFENVEERVKARSGKKKETYLFDSLVLDLDKTLELGTRNRIAEWEILNRVDPDQAKEIGNKLGIEG